MTYNAWLCHCEERGDEAISCRTVSRLAKGGTTFDILIEEGDILFAPGEQAFCQMSGLAQAF
jgi:hypothetical protein